MFRSWRLKKIHAKFLESCRNLTEDSSYWQRAGALRRWLLQALIPVPLTSLHEDGMLLMEALRWLEAHCRTVPVTEQVIRQYHRMVRGSDDAEAGEYRKGTVTVFGSTVPRPSPEKISPLLKQLEIRLAQDETNLKKSPDRDSALRLAVLAHQKIAFVHPFQDGNGRVARLVMNHVLRRHGLGYSVLPPISASKAHFDALEEAHRGKLESLVELARSCLHRV